MYPLVPTLVMGPRVSSSLIVGMSDTQLRITGPVRLVELDVLEDKWLKESSSLVEWTLPLGTRY